MTNDNVTLRQQLLDIDKLRQTHQIDNPEYIDRLVQVCQEIAREAYDKGYDDCLEEHGAVFKKEQE